MNTALQLLTGLLLAASTCQGNELKLEPNAILRFAFPELPDTLFAKAAGNHQPALLTAQLPRARDEKLPGGFKASVTSTGQS